MNGDVATIALLLVGIGFLFAGVGVLLWGWSRNG
jgi:hypothetical protein